MMVTKVSSTIPKRKNKRKETPIDLLGLKSRVKRNIDANSKRKITMNLMKAKMKSQKIRMKQAQQLRLLLRFELSS